MSDRVINALAWGDPRSFALLKGLRDEAAKDEERERCQGSLLEFLKSAWRPMGESGELSINWHHEAMIEALEALAHGEIRDCVFNIPPRFGKSLLCNVAFPAWLWTQDRDPRYPLMGPHLRVLSVSYASHLAERFGLKMLHLVMGEWYKGLWGDKVRIRADQMSRADFGNTRGGERISSSVEAGLLGRGGDLQICFPGAETILTASGPKEIGPIVRQRRPELVWSRAPSGTIELQPLDGWFENPGSEIVEVRLADSRTLYCTPEHRLWSQEGWVNAADAAGCYLLTQVFPDSALFNQKNLSGRDTKPPRKNAPRIIACDDLANLIFSKLRAWMRSATPATIRLLDMLQVFPGYTRPQSHYGATFNPEPFRQDDNRLGAFQCLNGLGVAQFGRVSRLTNGESAVAARVFDILRIRAIFKIAKMISSINAVKVSSYLSKRSRAHKCQQHQFMRGGGLDLAVAAEIEPPIPVALVFSTGENASFERPGLAVSPDHRAVKTAHAPEAGNLIQPFISGDRAPAFVRVDSVRHAGHVDKTYCVSVRHNHNMFMGNGNILASNCDDPHSIEGGESDIQREATLRAVSESLSTRVTDPRILARVLVTHRLHEEDVCDWVLDHWPRKTMVHLMFPARFDPNFACPQDPRTRDREPLWPEMWDEEYLARMEFQLGPYGWASQFQQVPSPREGGIVDIKDWRVWPEEPPDPASVRRLPGGMVVLDLPDVSMVVVSVDTAITERETSDWNACTTWGVWHRRRNMVTNTVGIERPWFASRWSASQDPEQVMQQLLEEDDQPRAILMEAWRRRCKLNDDTLDKLGKPQGLVQRIVETCRRRKADYLIIEDKTRGQDVVNEIERQMSDEKFRIVLFKPQQHGDKVARLKSVQPLFSQGLVYAPGNYDVVTDVTGHTYCEVREEMDWVKDLMQEIARVPRGRHDDLADSTTQALIYLRENGFLELTEQYIKDNIRTRMMPIRSRQTIADEYGVR